VARITEAVRRALGGEPPRDVLVEAAPVGLALLAEDLSPVRVNPAMTRLVGDELGRRLASADRDALMAGRSVPLGKLTARLAPAGAGWACVVTEGPAVAEARVDELARLTADLTAFSAAVAHHLRQPLRTVDIFTQLVLDDAGDALDARSRDYLARVRAAGRRMHAMMEALLRLARISRVELRREEVDLSAMGRHIVSELERRYPDHPVTVRIPPGITASCDRELTFVALEHLLDNAWKFTVGRPEPAVTFAREPWQGREVYVVRDNGVGLDPANAEQLFAELQHHHEARGEPTRAGIGLASVRRVIRRHDGGLWIDGAPGVGAAFRFTLGPEEGA
jgi:signal transduction histidine kinase